MRRLVAGEEWLLFRTAPFAALTAPAVGQTQTLHSTKSNL